jgi:hypothetical protein
MFNSQIKIVAQSTKSKIADALKAIIQGMPIFNYVAFDKIKLLASDFGPTEIPGAQFIDVAETITHERNRAKREWQLTLEVVLRSSQDEEVTQQDLWNIEYQISRKIWAVPNLGIPGVIHCLYVSNSTDLHLLEPFYLLRMDFSVLYYEHLVSDC